MADIHALDSRAALGLLAKAQQMFTSEETSLAFPLGTPLAFDAVQLAEAMGPAPDAVGHALLAEFSTAMNFVPSGIVWSPTGGPGLDDVVREIVGQGEWAEATRSPAEEARLVAAREQIDLRNPEMAEYASLRDAWTRSRERLANTPDDPDARAAERAAEAAMVSHPARARIEQAVGEVLALDERAPHRARDRFERMIADGEGTFSDPSGGTFSPVRLLPRAVVTSPGWDSVTLDRAALDELAAGAPPELTEHLRPPDGGDDPIRAISFEYASAVLHRSWFDSSIFDLRCWRFADEERRLSDGARPGSGECPSYVAAIVLARNVRVTSVAPQPAPDGTTDGAEAAIGSIDFILPEVLHELVVEPLPPPEEPLRPVRPDDLVDPVPPEELVDLGAVSTLFEPDVVSGTAIDRSLLIDDAALAAVGDVGVDVAMVHGLVARRVGVSRLGRVLGPADRASLAVAEPVAAQESAALYLEAARAPDFALLQSAVIEAPPDVAPAPAEPGLVTQGLPSGAVIVLALICKTVPRSPDPDPAAKWI